MWQVCEALYSKKERFSFEGWDDDRSSPNYAPNPGKGNNAYFKLGKFSKLSDEWQAAAVRCKMNTTTFPKPMGKLQDTAKQVITIN